jgi:predicted PhzF superfamily epimerase YddE/YHI9
VTSTEKEIILDFPLQRTGESLPFSLFKDLFEPTDIITAVQAYDDVIVELASEQLVRMLKPDFERVKQINGLSLIVTAKGKSPYDFVSRVFAPRDGINEDPVTGSAHCKLADYWQKKLGKSEFLSYQASARGGILGVRVVGHRVLLTGQAVTIMEGNLRVILGCSS